MITVEIRINGQVLYVRNAANITKRNANGELPDICQYRVDTGDLITHRRNERAVKLVIKMLETIREVNDK